MDRYERRRSWIWFLFPIFIQVIGGIIAYYALRPDEPRMAKDCLYIGITLTAINFGTFLLMLGVGFSFDNMMMSEIRHDTLWGI